MAEQSRCGIVIPLYSGAEQKRSSERLIEEATGLALAINLQVAFTETQNIRSKRPATLFGKGKVEELADRVAGQHIDLMIVDDALSPIQQRNLEKAWKCKVIDRTALILEIFGERARTKEGRLQVELASLNYQKGRLVRSWTHLERQRGGAGFMGGPGETQIESDRRIIGERITKLKRQLEQVTKTRRLHRENRQDVPYPVVALVGYTNAGKSTLFNRLTGANVMAEDLLFATLDPTMRGLTLPSGMQVILSDTVGFVSNLPTELVAAFRATLEEVIEADLILHIRDIADPDTDNQKADVLSILHDLLPEEEIETKVLEVHNKVDLVPDYLSHWERSARPQAETGEGQSNSVEGVKVLECSEGSPNTSTPQHPNTSSHPHPKPSQQVGKISTSPSGRGNHPPISALTGDGTDTLLDIADTKLQELLGYQNHTLTLPPTDGKKLAWLHKHGDIVNQDILEDGGSKLTVRIRRADWERFKRQ